MKFVDEARITVVSGHGGSGCVSFRREKYVPKGGPDGGDGGKGADVILMASSRFTTLLDLKYKKINAGRKGEPGRGRNRHGKNAPDLVINVPVGTVVKDSATSEVLADLVEDEQFIIIAKGGRGGKGNAHFSSSTHQIPRFAQPGEEGETRDITLELKLLADIGIIGLPNAGKSTFISKVSAARPKIADYPFTTLVPNLGVIRYKDFNNIVIADIPGLIEGAHSGAGLGTRFLKHVERTSLFIHVIDASGLFGNSPLHDFEVINNEIKKFNSSLAENPQLVALNKIDLITERDEIINLKNILTEKGYKVFNISAVTGEGVDALIDAAAEIFFRSKKQSDECT